MSAYDDLTPKQRAWVDAYLKTGNATEAARQAGYVGNDNTLGAVGGENLRKPTIQAALKERGETANRAKIADANEVLELLTGVARDEGAHPVARVRSLELLGKRYALWIEKHQVEHSGGIAVVPPRAQSLEEWERQAAASRPKE